MNYIKKKLNIEKISIPNITKKYGTPCYCYSYSKLKKNIINFNGKYC